MGTMPIVMEVSKVPGGAVSHMSLSIASACG